MEDASLDDFFAKKDKSKKKSKSKSSPADIVEKACDDSKPKKEKKKRDKEKNQSLSGTSQGSIRKDDEEWIDFQEETEKDLSGLRIQNMQIQTKEEDEDQEEGEELEEGETGETRDRQNATSGPWIGSGGGQQQKKQKHQKAAPGPALGTGPALGAGTPSEPTPQPPKPKEEAPKITGKYVPPGMRGSGGTTSAISTQQIRRKKEAPNIKSEEDFPTLGGMSKSEFGADASEGGYEHPGSKRGVQLSLENKFSALQD